MVQEKPGQQNAARGMKVVRRESLIVLSQTGAPTMSIPRIIGPLERSLVTTNDHRRLFSDVIVVVLRTSTDQGVGFDLTDFSAMEMLLHVATATQQPAAEPSLELCCATERQNWKRAATSTLDSAAYPPIS
jgi:hypothetical protein